ncbi:MAG: DUF1080 domain-containing protein [Opitutaceae bacterium]|nr:DUF1080 domain-containing protein [Opitutaceae bacterium]
MIDTKVRGKARLARNWRLWLTAAGMGLLVCGGNPLPAQATSAPEIAWHNLLKEAKLEGQGWRAMKHPFDRLPAAAEGVVRDPVWKLGEDSTGLRIRFMTDAGSVRARWTLRLERLAMFHMPATGVSGLDLYVRDADTWKWIGVGRPRNTGKSQDQLLVGDLGTGMREYLLYLPLYNGVDSVELGLPAGSRFEPAPDRYAERKPIVFYGTSITQGGCASRPGMSYEAILGRRLDWPTINLGFSGNGKSEPEMAQLIAELDPAVYVYDSLGNLTPEQTKERLRPFIKTLRDRHPTTPIVLLEHLYPPHSVFGQNYRTKDSETNGYLRQFYDEMRKAGDKHLHYVAASLLLGGDGEDTVDGLHPTDLGFMRMADGIEPVLRAALVDAGLTIAEEEGFVPLFDGKTLSGWKPHEGMPPIHRAGKWWVEDGVLYGTQDPPGKGGLLWLDRPFTNYILKLQVQVAYPMDTGVFLRVGPTGLSQQVTFDYRPRGYVGRIFIPFLGHTHVSRDTEGVRLVRPDTWNDLTIRIEGNPGRIRVWLNERLVTDFTHSEKTGRGLPATGGIALQVHPDVEGLTTWKAGNAVKFRNVRIKELP